MKYLSIQVMDNGNIIEFDEPTKLLENNTGYVYELFQNIDNNDI